VLLLIHEGVKQGVKHIVVTHAMIAPIHMNLAQMQESAKLGAYVEFVYNGLIGPYKEFTFADYAKAIRGIGPAHAILSSDLGQMQNPLHPDGWVTYLAGMKKEGFTDTELHQMSGENPAKLLDLK
jgi:predicted metal-dependent phosphotriesterase family hydrolase